MKGRPPAVITVVMTAVLSLGTLLTVAIPAAPAQAQATSQWQFTGSLAIGHNNFWNSGFVQLPDGRVLAISGSSGSGALTADAEIYTPATGQWTPAGTLNDARYAFGQPSVLSDGDVLVAGGHDVNVNDYATAELYDPATNQWTFTGSLNTSRRYPVQVELANGDVLVATGSHGPPTCTRYLSSAELYDPATGQWAYTGSTLVPRESANAIRLADGRVLLAGGYNGGGGACTDTDPVDTEVYDPSTGQWSYAGNLPHGWLGGAMVLLPDGRVLMVDGNQTGSGPFAEAVIFDPATNQWTEAAQPILPRSGAAATLLPDGDVLVSQGGQLQSEIYDPAANTWSLDATALDTNDGGHTFLLPDGQVLLAGGSDSGGSPTLTAELYSPAQTGLTTASLTDSSGNPISGAAVVFRSASGSVTNATTGSDGTAGADLTPGTYSVTMYYATGYQTKTIAVTAAGPNQVSFATVAVTAQINDPDSSDLAVATVSHAGNTGTYGPKTPVDGNGQVTFQVLPGTSTFAAWDAGGYETQTVTVTGQMTVTFATVAVTVTVDKNGSPLPTATVEHAGNIGTYGPKTPVDGNGQVTFQVLPGTSTFAAWDASAYAKQTLTVTAATAITISVA